jgi:predicted hydrolase (HD superfamily)
MEFQPPTSHLLEAHADTSFSLEKALFHLSSSTSGFLTAKALMKPVGPLRTHVVKNVS